MKLKETIEILELLADGTDPHTGEVFPADSAYQHPDTVRALFTAVRMLENVPSESTKRDDSPERAGSAWTRREDEELEKRFDEGASVKGLSQRHKRTTGAVRSRLKKLGKMKPTYETESAEKKNT